MPTEVKKVADKLNGKKMSLLKAVYMLQTATGGTISAKDGWVALELRESGGTRHMFRVIRFR